jgi:hypothetical protein
MLWLRTNALDSKNGMLLDENSAIVRSVTLKGRKGRGSLGPDPPTCTVRGMSARYARNSTSCRGLGLPNVKRCLHT